MLRMTQPSLSFAQAILERAPRPSCDHEPIPSTDAHGAAFCRLCGATIARKWMRLDRASDASDSADDIEERRISALLPKGFAQKVFFSPRLAVPVAVMKCGMVIAHPAPLGWHVTFRPCPGTHGTDPCICEDPGGFWLVDVQKLHTEATDAEQAAALRLFEFNDCEWAIGFNVEDAIHSFEKATGCDAEDHGGPAEWSEVHGEKIMQWLLDADGDLTDDEGELVPMSASATIAKFGRGFYATTER
jgi:hypothetical protein